MKKLIEIVCDGGENFGFGHIRRSTSLALAIEASGFCASLVILSEKSLDTDCHSYKIPVLRIIDLPYEIDEFVLESKKMGFRCIALDYFGDANPHLTISIFEHRQNLPMGNRVSGFKYAIIRPEISQAQFQKKLESVLIIIGGSDIRNYGDTIAQKISLFCKSVCLVQGPMNSSNYKTSNPSVFVLKDPINLQDVMVSAKWGITNGGGSMMEMMSLGKAVYVVPQTREEDNLARYLLKIEAILGIGIDSIKEPSKKRINQVGQKAKSIIDGFGIKRIIGHVSDQVDACNVLD